MTRWLPRRRPRPQHWQLRVRGGRGWQQQGRPSSGCQLVRAKVSDFRRRQREKIICDAQKRNSGPLREINSPVARLVAQTEGEILAPSGGGPSRRPLRPPLHHQPRHAGVRWLTPPLTVALLLFHEGGGAAPRYIPPPGWPTPPGDIYLSSPRLPHSPCSARCAPHRPDNSHAHAREIEKRERKKKQQRGKTQQDRPPPPHTPSHKQGI